MEACRLLLLLLFNIILDAMLLELLEKGNAFYRES
jgi:hypothetical protein